jgi:ATP/maltotriose-dependent transcriptional regulator MalT
MMLFHCTSATACNDNQVERNARRELLLDDDLLHGTAVVAKTKRKLLCEAIMTELKEFKVTQRDGQILQLLLEGCSNKEIAQELNISPRTVKQHLRSLFQRAGIEGGRKRVKLATALVWREQVQCNHVTV